VPTPGAALRVAIQRTRAAQIEVYQGAARSRRGDELRLGCARSGAPVATGFQKE
jgi:uncharacterized radical SAM superfamily protein